MTPAAIAAHLDAEPIVGLTHHYGEDGWLDLSTIADGCPIACASLRIDVDDLGAVMVITNARIDSVPVTVETLRTDLVTVLAWSLGHDEINSAAPETRAALRSPSLYGEVLRKHLEDRRDALAAVELYPNIVAALTAALKETST
jgi:hypothetical protein